MVQQQQYKQQQRHKIPTVTRAVMTEKKTQTTWTFMAPRPRRPVYHRKFFSRYHRGFFMVRMVERMVDFIVRSTTIMVKMVGSTIFYHQDGRTCTPTTHYTMFSTSVFLTIIGW